MRSPDRSVDVQNGRLVISDRPGIDLIRHVYDAGADRNLLRDVVTRLDAAERAGA